MKNRKKRRRIKPRNYLVPQMRLGRKAGPMTNRKKEQAKRGCRRWILEKIKGGVE